MTISWLKSSGVCGCCVILIWISLVIFTSVDNSCAETDTGNDLLVHDSSFKSYQKALKKFELLSDSQKVVETLSSIGELYYTESHYAQAHRYFLQAKHYLRNSSTCSERLNIELDLSRVRYSLNDKSEALTQMEDVFNDMLNCADNDLKFRTLYYLAVVSYELAKWDSSIHFLHQAIDVANQSNDLSGLSKCHGILGEIYIWRRDELDKGKKEVFIALDLAQESGDWNSIAFANIKVSMFYNFIDQLDSSVIYLDSSEKYFKKLGSLRDIVYVKHNRADIFRKQGNADSSYSTMNALFSLYDTIFQREKRQDVSRYRTLYETEKKEQENLQLNIENQQAENRNKSLVTYFSLSIAVLVLIGSGIFWRTRSRRLKEKERLQQNMLNAIIEAEEKERVRIAKDLHDGVGQMISMARLHVASMEDEVPEEYANAFSTSLKSLDNAVEEVRNVSHDLMPGVLVELGLVAALRQLSTNLNEAGLIAVHLNCQTEHDRFHPSSELALYRVVQEVTNNMIRHSEATEIHILLTENNGHLVLKISDNGKGFDVSTISQSKGIGWRNILSRIQMINGKVDIRSGSNTGTEVEVYLPMQY